MTIYPVASADEIVRRLAGTPLVLMLDVDGTLAPIVPRPQDASVPEETRCLLATLAAREGVHIAAVSGRGAADARRLVAVASAWVLGNHGIEMLSPTGDTTVAPEVERFRTPMARVARAIGAQVAHVPGVVVEDKTWTLTVHYRLADPGVVSRLRRMVDEGARAEGLRTVDAKKAVEVRPPVRIDKGTAVVALAARLGAFADGASLLFAGDDVTDEDAFRALRAEVPHAVTVRVADDQERRATAAEFVVRDPGELRGVLAALAASRP